MSRLELTTAQRDSAGRIFAEEFGADFQTGEYAGGQGWIYIACKMRPGPVDFYYIAPDGTVVKNPT